MKKYLVLDENSQILCQCDEAGFAEFFADEMAMEHFGHKIYLYTLSCDVTATPKLLEEGHCSIADAGMFIHRKFYDDEFKK